MRNVMQRFWATYILDLRLTVFHWSYLLFLAAWSGFIVTNYAVPELNIPSLFNIVLGFIGLLGMFFTGVQASRSQRNRFDMLEVALPSGVEVLLARWLAIITALLGLLIAPLFVIVTAPASLIDVPYILTNLLFILIAVSFGTGLVWLVQNTIGIRRWMYPLFGVLWLGAGLLPNVLSNDGLPTPGINLTNFVTMNQSINSPVWGQFTQNQLPQLTVLFYVGLVLLFAGIMLWRTMATRFHRRSPAIIAFTVAALGIVLFAGSSYTMQVYAANQQVLDEDQYQQDFADQIISTAAMPFEVTAYDVTFALGTPTQLSAQINVTNRSDTPLSELTFSLYHQFEVTDASQPFTRERDTLTLTLPQALAAGESTQVSVDYQGNIAYLERRLGRPPEATYFVRPEGVNLACAVLWYPVPGQLLPNRSGYFYTGSASCILDNSARFHLTIAEPGMLQYASNLTQIDATTFVSEGATWAQLIGAPNLQTTTDSNLTIVTTPSQFEGVSPRINQYLVPPFQHLQRIFPDVQHLTVVALQLTTDSFSQWVSYPATQESAVVIIAPRQFDFLASSLLEEYHDIGKPLITSMLGGQNTILTDNISYFLWVHYLENGDVEQMRPIIENGLPQGGFYTSIPYKEYYTISFALYDVYVAQGETVLFDLLRQMRAEIETLNTMSTQQLLTWIEETVNAD
jgi:hypothetical protein